MALTATAATLAVDEDVTLVLREVAAVFVARPLPHDSIAPPGMDCWSVSVCLRSGAHLGVKSWPDQWHEPDQERCEAEARACAAAILAAIEEGV